VAGRPARERANLDVRRETALDESRLWRSKGAVAVIGCHRSGTSLLSRMLLDAGLFMGTRRNSHEESSFFLRQNQHLFRAVGAEWDSPEAVGAWAADPARSGNAESELRRALGSMSSLAYWGPHSLTRTLGSGPTLWGWKDPRTSFTLPLWKCLLPQLRVVHLCRHGVDVAQSLLTREHTRRGGVRHRPASQRCVSFADAFDLWRAYESACLRATAELPPDRSLRIRYEDLLTDPRANLHRLAEFAGLATTPQRIDRAAADIRPSGAFAHRSSPRLRKRAAEQDTDPVLRALGYGSDTSP